MSVPDQDARSIGPYCKTGHLISPLDWTERFARSWVETMFFRYVPANLPSLSDLPFPSASASATLSKRAMFASRQTTE